jgi:bifunctional non-homologous end joining protein LigD
MRWKPPMLAVLTEERFSDEAWVYERKLDGERCLAYRRDVRLLSRTRQPLNGTYPELVDALLAQGCDEFVVDGEQSGPASASGWCRAGTRADQEGW